MLSLEASRVANNVTFKLRREMGGIIGPTHLYPPPASCSLTDQDPAVIQIKQLEGSLEGKQIVYKI